jgi:hypothetical protein
MSQAGDPAFGGTLIQTKTGNMDILTILILPTQEQRILSIYLCLLQFFHHYFIVVNVSFYFLAKFILISFFVAIMSGFVSLTVFG